MDASFDRLQELFGNLVEREPQERARLLEELARDEPELHAEVLDLLACHDEAPAFLRDEAFAPPQRVGPYRLIASVASGGSGVVYRAEQEQPKRIVALKLLQASAIRPEHLERFAVEIEVLGRLSHPSIARIYDAGSFTTSYGAQPYIAMEFVDGEAITHYARRHGLDIDQRCALLVQVCDAVQHAHERGVLHRDLKPANVFVTFVEGLGPTVKVLDFGIARCMEADSSSTLLTKTGQLLGTLPYMSPEQLEGTATDARADVYALGVLLFELLSGHVPLSLEGMSLSRVVEVVTRQEAPDLRKAVPGVAADLALIVGKALSKDRAARYTSPAELAADLRRFAEDLPIVARRPTTLYRLRKFASRNRGPVSAVVSVFGVLVSGIVAVSILAEQNRRLAERERDARRGERRSRYFAEMNLAAAALADGRFARARSFVDAWRDADNDGIRGYEWHWLAAASNSGEGVLEVGGVQHAIAWIDARRVLCQDDDGAVVWDIEARRALLRLRGAVRRVPFVALSPDHRRIALVGDATIDIHRVEDGALLRRFEVPIEPIRPVWLRDGRGIAFTDPKGAVHIIDSDTGRTLQRFDENTAVLAFSTTGRFALAGPKSIAVGEVDDWQIDRRFRCSEDTPSTLAFSPDARSLAVGGNSGRVVVLDVDSGRELRSISHDNHIFALAWRKDGRRLASGGRDHVLREWDLDRDRVIEYRGHGNAIWGVAYDEGSGRLATASEDGTLRFWRDAPAPAGVTVDVGATNTVDTVNMRTGWSPDDRVHASLPGTQRGFAIDDGGRVAATNGLEHQWSQDAAIEAYVRDGTVVVKRVADDVSVTLPPGFERVTHENGGLELSPCGRYVAFATRGAESALWIWAPFAKAEPVLVEQRWVSAFTWDPASRYLAVATASRVELVDPRNGRVVDACEVVRANALAFDAKGALLAIADVRLQVQLWSIAEGRSIGTLSGHADRIRSLDWHPDGKRLASVGNDARLRLWDTQSNVLALELPLDTRAFAVRWHRDGQRLCTVSDSGTVTFFDARRSYAAPR